MSGWVVGPLVRASVEGLVFGGVVWALCRWVPRIPAGARSLLWWAACLKLLVGLTGVALVPVAVPVPMAVPMPGLSAALPRQEEGMARARFELPGTGTPGERAPRPAIRTAAGASLEGAPSPGASSAWNLLAGLWAIGALVSLARLGMEIGRSRRILREAGPVTEASIVARFGELAARVGLSGIPRLLESAAIDSPQAMGFLRPAVVVPVAGLGGEELEMALCHELVHLRRRDLWLGWVPALAERLFFFHPVASWAAREYALAREGACDAEVLRILGSGPREYGRLLLRLGVTRRPAQAFALGAAPAFATLKRRLEMLQNAADSTRRRPLWLGLIALAALAALPSIRLVAASPAASPKAPAAPAAPQSPTTARTPVTPQTPVTPRTPATPTTPRAAAVAPTAAVAVVASAQAVAPASPRESEDSEDVSTWSWGDGDDGDSYVLRLGKNQMMHGSSGDADAVKKLSGDLLWVRRDGKEYVIRDAALLQKAQELVRPQMELGAQQAELGARQAELGEKQAELGAKQGELGRKQGELGAQQGQLGAEQARLRREGQEAEEIETRQHELGRLQGELGQKQGELGRLQGELGKKQGELGRQQGELGRRQAETARQARTGLAKLIDEAIARGLVSKAQ